MVTCVHDVILGHLNKLDILKSTDFHLVSNTIAVLRVCEIHVCIIMTLRVSIVVFNVFRLHSVALEQTFECTRKSFQVSFMLPQLS